MSAKQPPKKKDGDVPEDWPWTHVPPSIKDRSKNGRKAGRRLIAWTRPRMFEKLLLALQYELSRYNYEIPWNNIAHRLHPGSSGSAVVQQLARLRSTLIAEGHVVPPVVQRPGSGVVVDPRLRGYVRSDPHGPDTLATRPVLFTEPMDDLREGLPDAFTYQPRVDGKEEVDRLVKQRRAKKKNSASQARTISDGPDESVASGHPRAATTSKRLNTREARRNLLASIDDGTEIDEDLAAAIRESKRTTVRTARLDDNGNDNGNGTGLGYDFNGSVHGHSSVRHQSVAPAHRFQPYARFTPAGQGSVHYGSHAHRTPGQGLSAADMDVNITPSTISPSVRARQDAEHARFSRYGQEGVGEPRERFDMASIEGDLDPNDDYLDPFNGAIDESLDMPFEQDEQNGLGGHEGFADGGFYSRRSLAAPASVFDDGDIDMEGPEVDQDFGQLEEDWNM